MTVKTKKSQAVVDITRIVENHLRHSTLKSGICHLFITHTTACLTTADLDPGTDLDTLDFLNAAVPQINFRHPHDPSHTPDHIWSSIIGPSISVPFQDKKLCLGMWQRIVLIELDGPRERNLIMSLVAA